MGERREGDLGGLHHHLIITEQYSQSGKILGQRDKGVTLT